MIRSCCYWSIKPGIWVSLRNHTITLSLRATGWNHPSSFTTECKEEKRLLLRFCLAKYFCGHLPDSQASIKDIFACPSQTMDNQQSRQGKKWPITMNVVEDVPGVFICIFIIVCRSLSSLPSLCLYRGRLSLCAHCYHNQKGERASERANNIKQDNAFCHRRSSSWSINLFFPKSKPAI